MSQDNAAKAAELIEVGRTVFGDQWAEKVEEMCEGVGFEAAVGGLVCDRCGALVCYEYEQVHRDYHRLLTVGIHFANSASSAAWAHTEGVEEVGADTGTEVDAGPAAWLAALFDAEDALAHVVRETEDHTFGRPGYDLTLDDLHDTATNALGTVRAAIHFNTSEATT